MSSVLSVLVLSVVLLLVGVSSVSYVVIVVGLGVFGVDYSSELVVCVVLLVLSWHCVGLCLFLGVMRYELGVRLE